MSSRDTEYNPNVSLPSIGEGGSTLAKEQEMRGGVMNEMVKPKNLRVKGSCQIEVPLNRDQIPLQCC